MSAPSARWPLACFAALGVYWGTWAALLPDIRAQVGASDAELGLAMLGTGAGALPAMLLTGRLWRRFGWWLLPACATAFAIAMLGPALAFTPVALGIAVAFVGAASGALDVAMNAAVSDVEVAANRRLMYGAHALFSLAVLVGSVVTGIAREAGLGPSQLLPAAAAFMAVVAVGSITSARTKLPTPVAAVQTRATRRLAVQAIAVLAVLCALAFLIEDAIQNWSALHLERGLGATPAIGGAAPGIFAGAMFLGRSSGQWLGSRFTDRTLLVCGALVAAAGLVIVAYAPTAPIGIAGLAMSGAGVALVAPALFARAGRMAGPSGRGAAIASLTVFGYLGFLVGPVVVGLVSQAAGLPTAIAVLAVLALLLAAIGAIALGGRRSGSYAEGEELMKTGRA